MKSFRLVIAALFIFQSSCFAQDVFEAARTGNIKRLEELVKLKPDTVNSKNAAGFTPLIIAGYRDQMEAVKFLIAHKADVNAGSPEGPALLGACYKGNVVFAEILIRHKAEVNAVNTHGTTALMYATMSKNVALVKLLLEHGAKKNLKEKSGKTALDYAGGHEEIVDILTQN